MGSCVLEIARGTSLTARPATSSFRTFRTHRGSRCWDGLIWIRENADSSLAFRFSCINANVCKECVMLVDGKNAYACTARLKTGRTRVEPLKGKRRLRDLACDTVPPKEKIGGSGARS